MDDFFCVVVFCGEVDEIAADAGEAGVNGAGFGEGLLDLFEVFLKLFFLLDAVFELEASGDDHGDEDDDEGGE